MALLPEGYEFPKDWPTPQEYLVELGRVSAVWSALESTLTVAINKLAGFTATVDYRALILLLHASFQQRLDMLGALCEELQAEYPHLRGYPEVVSSVRAAQKSRNRLMHNGILFNEDTGTVQTSYGSARGKLKLTVEDVTVKQIREAAAEAHLACCKLHSLITRTNVQPMWSRNA